MLKINHIAKTFNRGQITEKTALADVQLLQTPVVALHEHAERVALPVDGQHA